MESFTDKLKVTRMVSQGVCTHPGPLYSKPYALGNKGLFKAVSDGVQ